MTPVLSGVGLARECHSRRSRHPPNNAVLPNTLAPCTNHQPPQLLINKVSEEEYLAKASKQGGKRQTLRIKACYELDKCCMRDMLKVGGGGGVGWSVKLVGTGWLTWSWLACVEGRALTNPFSTTRLQ
jgi:hypothetical protein